jgi:murein DD-endopeptidase MepM/ murein hydrolase activator NlpD
VNGTSLTAEVRRAHTTWPFIDAIEKSHKLPPKLLYAVGWRETHLQNIMGDFSQRPGESSPRHHGFGVWQRDSDAFGVGPAYLKNVRRQAMDAANLLAANFRTFDRWDAAVAAYNCGPGSVQKALAAGSSVDRFTTGGDYSHDVLATRQAMVRRRARPEGQSDEPDPKVVPSRGYFRPGHHNELFTLMGKRFVVWLRKDIAKAGATYTPGPEFSTFDRLNVKMCQVLMGDEPDGWFGQSQWTRLLTEKPPRRPPSRGAAPVSGLRVTQGFGVKNARYAAGEHTGIDFGDSGDDTIRATRHGVVVTASFDSDGFGNYVVLQHEGMRFSWYCHLARRSVSVGDHVMQGHQVGMMGATGNADGKHLHYQETLGGHSYWDYVRPTLLS